MITHLSPQKLKNREGCRGDQSGLIIFREHLSTHGKMNGKVAGRGQIQQRPYKLVLVQTQLPASGRNTSLITVCGASATSRETLDSLDT